MLGTFKDQTLFLLLDSFGLLLLGPLVYGIYKTFGPLSHIFSDTTNEHERMHQLRISHGHNSNNHYEAEHIH